MNSAINAQRIAYKGVMPRYISTRMLPQNVIQNKQLNGLKSKYFSVSLLYGSNINSPTNNSDVESIPRLVS